MENIGLIAGNGTFPLVFAREAQARGVAVTAVAHRGETLGEIDDVLDDVTWVRVGELGKMIRVFKKAGVERAVMAGGINKVRSLGKVRPDLRGLKLLRRAAGRGDDALLRAVAAEFESEGIEVVSSTLFLERIVVRQGLVAGPRPARTALADVRLGCRVLGVTGALDVGQGVVVENGVILAVEAVEGTDEAVRRGGALGRGAAVVVKAAKPDQDMRFDVPAIGPRTIEIMAECGARTLAVEAGRCIVLDGERVAELAARHRISVVGCNREGDIGGT